MNFKNTPALTQETGLLTRPVRDKLLTEMIISLLVVTSQPDFGEYIRQSLKEIDSAHIEIVNDRIAALYELQMQRFTHVFLDSDLKSDSTLNLGLALRRTDPALHVIVVSANQTPPRLDALRPWTLLRKPFSRSDLLRIFQEESNPSRDISHIEKAPVEKENTPDWMQDVSKAAQQLTRLTLESSAQATLIIRDGEMWAYAGQLSEAASAELVKIVVRDKKQGDLLKFLRLDATQAEHMLFSTELKDKTNLAMIFDAETPFSAIRRQAMHLAESLAFSLEATPPSEKPLAEKPPAEKTDRYKETEIEAKDVAGLFDFEEGEENDLAAFSEILSNIPNPTPDDAASEAKTSPYTSPNSKPLAPTPPPTLIAEKRPSTPLPSVQERSPAIPANNFFQTSEKMQVDLAKTHVQEAQPRQYFGVEIDETRVQEVQPRQSIEIDLDETRVQEAQPQQSIGIDLEVTRVSKTNRPSTPIRRPNPEELVETRPQQPIVQAPGRVILEPSPSGTYDLTYACLLVPRFSSHHLTGDLADRLSEWMPKICVAFGWRLGYIAIRPDYLQWVINVPPTASPGYLMRIMRTQTSKRIFEDFPRHKAENPSGDFWAPGYLIMGGSQPHPSTLVKDYIQRTRERQGV